jgi:hypothetical protein
MKPWRIVQIAYVEIRYISTGVGIKPPTPPITKKNEHPTPLIHIIESRYKGGSMGIGRRPTDDKIEVLASAKSQE